ncbi:hypothetical protein LCGC14_1390920 [marine sediment metagenome]|uniref:Uncharacterized protein n=1 Tax=marine sediment metagenome TaxID=412755 RepID=A0A0F9K003_9ZZZZ
MTNVKTKLKYSKEWEEYSVEVLIDGVPYEDYTYYTADRNDAVETRKNIDADIIERPQCYKGGK